jgi:hypothetical protein
MAKLVPDRVLDLKKPLVARRPFTAAGRHYEVGAPVDWRKMLATPRRIKQMFDAGTLMHGEAAAEATAKDIEKLAAAIEEDVDDEDDDADDDDEDEELDDVPAPAPAKPAPVAAKPATVKK